MSALRAAWVGLLVLVMSWGLAVEHAGRAEEASSAAQPELPGNVQADSMRLLNELREAGDTPEKILEILARGDRRALLVVLLGSFTGVLLVAGIGGGVALLVLWRQGRIKARASWAPGGPWTLLDIVEAIAFFMVAQLAVALVLRTALEAVGIKEREGPGVLVLMALSYVLSAVATVLLLGVRTPGGLSGLRRAVRFPGHRIGRRILQGAVGYAIIFPVFIGAAWLTRGQRNPLESNPVIPVIVESGGVWAKVLALALLSVCAPLFEETLFRGFVYQTLRRRWGVATGVIVTGVLFGLVHQYLPGVLPLSVLGMGFAMMYEVTGSLVPSMVAHATQNALAFAVLMLLMS